MSYKIYSDEYFMNEALKEAMKAREEHEIPVGAVIVADRRIIARPRSCMMSPPTQKCLP